MIGEQKEKTLRKVLREMRFLVFIIERRAPKINNIKAHKWNDLSIKKISDLVK